MRSLMLLAAFAGCSFDVPGLKVEVEPDLSILVEDFGPAPDLLSLDLSEPDLLPTPDLAGPAFCPADPTLAACYRFDDGFHPAVVQDDSMYGNDGTATGASFPAGHSGAALTLSVNGSVVVGDHTSLNIPGPISFEVWVRANSLVAVNARGGLLDNDGQYGLFVINGNRAQCNLGSATIQSHNNSITVGVWHHVACTYDRVTARIFVDGIEHANQKTNQALTNGTANGLNLGSDSPSGDIFDGMIDDLRIWSVTRTPLQICQAAGTC